MDDLRQADADVGSSRADFAAFFAVEAEQLTRFCWMLTLDADEAADLAQEVMERAFRRWDQLGADGNNPAGWIRTVAVNLSRSQWRRVRRFRALAPRLARSSSQREPVNDPDLADALRSLAPRQRQVVALRYWADLPLDDCAGAMGISVGSVKQHLARAHRNLAAVLDPTILEELVL